MIAPSPKPRARLDAQSRDQFLRLLPAIQKQIEARFRTLRPELREELSAEALALCVQMFVSLVARDKADLAYATPLATYGCRQAVAGRRLGSPRNAHDVTSRCCQKQNVVRIERLDHGPVSGDWAEVLVEARTADPAETAAARIDFHDWLVTLGARNRRIAETLATGESTGRVAKLFHISAARVSQLRRELYSTWQEFHGEPAEVMTAHA